MAEGVRGDASIPLWKLVRYRLCVLIFLGFAVVYALRVNLSVAIVDMVKNGNKANITGQCAKNQSNGLYGLRVYLSSSTSGLGTDKKFDWDDAQQAQVLGAFFYGYILTQIPGGWLADKFGARLLFGVGVGGTAVLTILTEAAADLGFNWLIALRVLQGIGEGVTFPAISSFWGRWAPPNERASLAGVSMSGAQFGTIISLPLSGAICQYLGWSIMFYIFGAVGCVWVFTWFMIVENTPAEYKSIDPLELAYITHELPSSQQTKPSVPWKNVLTSWPFLAITFTHLFYNWTFYAILTYLPKYLNNVHGFDLSKSGFVSGLPYLIMWLIILGQSQLSDWLLRRDMLSRTAVRRIFNTIGMFIPAMALCMITKLKCNTDSVIAMICVCCGFSGFVFSGFITPNHADLSSVHAGTLMGITNMMATIPGFLAPLANGQIINGHENEVNAWAPVWYLAASLNICGGLVYLTFASGNEQPWSTRPVNLKEQLKFEIDQFLFRDVTNLDNLPILEGDEDDEEAESVSAIENPNYN